ncbi:MAG: dephospho-CoA kinase [Formosimonas sp.]
MSPSVRVGLTGRMGAGKSTVACMLRDAGAVVVDFDAIARRVTAAGGVAIAPIVAAFGAQMLDEHGALHRTRMRELVFQQPAAKQQLEAITHPLISAQAEHEAAQASSWAVVYDIPLLYGNTYWLQRLDVVVAVLAAESVLLERIGQRNPDYMQQTIQAILATQATDEQLRHIADKVLDNSINDANHLHLYTQVNILVGYLKSMYKNNRDPVINERSVT